MDQISARLLFEAVDSLGLETPSRYINDDTASLSTDLLLALQNRDSAFRTSEWLTNSINNPESGFENGVAKCPFWIANRVA